ncbi:hypothetical protein SAMN05421595_3106 [Austwickia chelonae]|uniref:Uncharacterized protein n=1 Tax=Austwickia chelonae NBRC 105200 TaxID=1184607 RepID=K6WBZ3_9MICO|nr:hypothetical protein [Austwickia chelonae]GAB79352.1 hypothetical protein AUCHE_24_00050 [Austwickia chelonae NBRC 105200]SEW43978.1 hypothetical protein SAMN05421595_3106 [Austwickia chelonae]
MDIDTAAEATTVTKKTVAKVRPPRHVHPSLLPAMAERDMLTVFAAGQDVPPLAPRTVRLEGDQIVQVDGVSPDEDLFVIPISYQGVLPEDAGAHLARDMFTLSLVASAHPGSRAVLLFACEEARDSAKALVGGLDRRGEISLEVVDLGVEWRERLVEGVRPAGRHRAG